MTGRSQGLTFRFTVATTLILIALGTVTGLLVRGLFYRSLSAELDARGVLLARYIATRNANSILEENDLDLLDIQLSLVDVMKQVPSLEYGYILNSRGRILAHTFTTPFPTALLNINRVGTDKSLSIRRVDVGDHVLRDIGSHVAGPGTGEIHLGISERTLDADIGKVTMALLAIFGGFSIGAIILVLAASSTLTRPVHDLTRAAERLGAGEFGTRVRPLKGRELGILGDTFNRMAQNLQETREGLWALNQELKEEVVERKQAQDALATALREKETLLREVHHRIKNNLQSLSGLLTLQAYYSTQERTRSILNDCCSRLQTMSLIHRGLYESKDLANVPFDRYIEQLSRQVLGSQISQDDRISLSLDLEPATLSVETAIPAGLILNELLTNSIKHAFPNGGRGHVTVRFKAVEAGWFRMEVEDDGQGLPEGMDFSKVRSMGMQLVKVLTEQLGGKVEIGTGESSRKGARFAVTFQECHGSPAQIV